MTMPCFSKKPCFCATQIGHSVELLNELSVICFCCAEAGALTASTTTERHRPESIFSNTAHPPLDESNTNYTWTLGPFRKTTENGSPPSRGPSAPPSFDLPQSMIWIDFSSV